MNIDWASFTPWTALAGGALIGLAAGLLLLGGCDQAEKAAQQMLSKTAETAKHAIDDTHKAAEQALTDTTNHFIQCFAAVEKRCLDSGRSLDTLTHGEWIEMWNRTKRSFEEEAADAIG